MSQMKSAVFGALFFIGLIVPALLMFGIDSLHQNAFAKVTKEITELVQEDAGVSDRVKSVVNDYKPKGYVITFKDQFGQAVNGIMNYGDTVYVNFKYTYKSVFKDQTIESTNKAYIAKRNGVNTPGWSGGGSNSGSELKTFTATTTLSGNSTQEQTFVIPGLNQLQRVSTNTGSVQVVKVEGDRVTVRASGGSVKKRIQTGGELKPDETKNVTETVVDSNSSKIPNSIQYNKDGFVGTLTRIGEMKARQTGGKLVPGETKQVGNQPSPNYQDSEGFTGKLERYVHSGTYIPPKTKYVTDQLNEYYNDGEYKGTLTRYNTAPPTVTDTNFEAREAIRAMCEFVWGGGGGTSFPYKYAICEPEIPFPETIEYDKDGYKGTLTLKYEEWGAWYNYLDWECVCHVAAPDYIIGVYEGTVTYTPPPVYRYQGYVTKPGVDTRVWRYGGTVTKPGSDTRTYEYTQEYRGTVTKPGKDTRTFENRYQYDLLFEYR